MRARRRSQPDSGAPSLDSFLDVVTNLVGILIILIMVVGVTAKDALVQAANQLIQPGDAPPALSIASVPETPDLADETLLRRRQALASEVQRLAQQIQAVDREATTRHQERGELQLLLSSANESLEEITRELDEEHQQRVRAQSELLAENQRLEKMYDQIESLQEYRPEIRELAHYATPLAQTVFGEEEHFRLSAGRLTYVPINQLVDMMKKDAVSKARQMNGRETISGSVGPLGGFTCEYTLRQVGYQMETSMGTATRKGIELDHFVLVPTRNDLGETLEEALRPNSRFRELIGSFDPNRTTITVWTYPDSFDSFRAIKDDLFEIGFSTAARPLPEGHPIGGSPHGQRSSSQ